MSVKWNNRLTFLLPSVKNVEYHAIPKGRTDAFWENIATKINQNTNYFRGKNFSKSFPIGGTVSSTTPRKSKPSRIPRPKVLEGDLELLREFQEQFLRRAPQHLPGPDPTTLSANASRPTTPSVVSRPLPQYSIKMPRLLISILITPTQIVRNNVSDQ
ncbi:hypothetical protein GLOIN_2v1787822 [Rhizophagus irregularis DAOM 181602=DAOM 197198]|nr:hypothetical protein GLOIN_2v1787822 [Rhizophagus irregularis DAOM 181602=DAOM 197198]